MHSVSLRFKPVVLYVCRRKWFGPTPPKATRLLGPLASAIHPCTKAARALDGAGCSYELRTVGGYRASPWTWGKRDADRAEVRRLSGTNEVPILVLDDGAVISGSSRIVRWAREHPRAAQP